MRTGSFLLTLACIYTCNAQENLVPNPSFEDSIGCSTSAGQIWRAPPWERVGGSGVVTYYQECAPLCCGIPNNRGGGGYARTGVAFIDIGLVHNNHVLSFHAEGNFLGCSLNSELEAGKRYNVELYLSLADSMRFAGKNIGVYFSQGKPFPGNPFSDIDSLLTLVPQVRYEGDFLTDKEGWMPVVGNFIAQGGENYMTIGNFDGYFNSDTLNLHEGGVSPTEGYWETAYYFIDDVSVVEDTSYHVGVEEQLSINNEQLTIWPNPSGGEFSVAMQLPDERAVAELEIWDITGRKVHSNKLSTGLNNIDARSLNSGLYVLIVRVNGSVVHTGREVITR